VSLRVEPRNDAPAAADDAAAARPRRLVVIRVLGNDEDVDGDRLTLRGMKGGPFYGSARIDESGTAITYRPRRGTAGRADRIAYKVTDGNGAVDAATVRIRIRR
nr:cadherin-like domain-containing protein [Actinomycetota bacterium]